MSMSTMSMFTMPISTMCMYCTPFPCPPFQPGLCPCTLIILDYPKTTWYHLEPSCILYDHWPFEFHIEQLRTLKPICGSDGWYWIGSNSEHYGNLSTAFCFLSGAKIRPISPHWTELRTGDLKDLLILYFNKSFWVFSFISYLGSFSEFNFLSFYRRRNQPF